MKSAPRELVRRGLDDGTERLRGQLRDAAQRGQSDDYGGDRIEDAAAYGGYRTRRGVEDLLKKKRTIRRREQDSGTHSAADHTGAVPSEEDRTGPPLPERMARAQLKAKKSSVREPCPDAPLVPQSKPEPFKIKAKDAQPPMPETQPQTFAQGKQEFMQQQGRAKAMKQAEARRTGNGAIPQSGSGGEVSYTIPARHGYAHSAHRPSGPGGPDGPAAREGKRAASKSAPPGRKAAERVARQTIKAAECAPEKVVKTAERTVKTAQAAARGVQRAAQAARATAKTAAATVKAAAKATVAAIKGAIAATQELIAAIAAGGWVALVVVLVICMVGLLVASPFGIFFSGGGNSPDASSPTALISQINSEYADALAALRAGGDYDRVEVQGRPPSWLDVFAVFAVKTAGGADGTSVAVLGPDNAEKLREVFWNMTKLTTSEETIKHPAEGDTPTWTETVLTITVTPRTTDDMRVFYSFTEEQNASLDELLAEGSRGMWSGLLYGSSSEFVAMALSQVGNVGGQPYWSWYGFSNHVEWCACFVSWCADKCGYIDAGVIPKFASCSIGSKWFRDRGQWQDGGYEPRPGDLIFFDWDNRGSSGPQDEVPDHVGIVERVENGVVYTVEGNSGDSCRQRSYRVGHYEIWGYACPIYN